MRIQNSEEESYQLEKINELRAKKLKRQQEETRLEQVKAQERLRLEMQQKQDEEQTKRNMEEKIRTQV